MAIRNTDVSWNSFNFAFPQCCSACYETELSMPPSVEETAEPFLTAILIWKQMTGISNIKGVGGINNLLQLFWNWENFTECSKYIRSTKGVKCTIEV